jgi:hypothetical protein
MRMRLTVVSQKKRLRAGGEVGALDHLAQQFQLIVA